MGGRARAGTDRLGGLVEAWLRGHTALVYLWGRDGRLAGTINYQESADTQLKKLRRLIGE